MISVPRCLTGSLQGRRDGSVLADCVGGEDETEGGSRIIIEEDETGPNRWLAPRWAEDRTLGVRPSEHT